MRLGYDLKKIGFIIILSFIAILSTLLEISNHFDIIFSDTGGTIILFSTIMAIFYFFGLIIKKGDEYV